MNLSLKTSFWKNDRVSQFQSLQSAPFHVCWVMIFQVMDEADRILNMDFEQEVILRLQSFLNCCYQFNCHLDLFI